MLILGIAGDHGWICSGSACAWAPHIPQLVSILLGDHDANISDTFP